MTCDVSVSFAYDAQVTFIAVIDILICLSKGTPVKRQQNQKYVYLYLNYIIYCQRGGSPKQFPHESE